MEVLSFDLWSFQICQTVILYQDIGHFVKVKKTRVWLKCSFVGSDVCGANMKQFDHAHNGKPGKLGILSPILVFRASVGAWLSQLL